MYITVIWYTYTLWKDLPSSWFTRHIHHLTYLSFFLFLVRTLKLYSISKFHLYKTVLSTIVTVFYTRYSGLVLLISWKFYPFLHFAYITSSMAPTDQTTFFNSSVSKYASEISRQKCLGNAMPWGTFRVFTMCIGMCVPTMC